MCLRYQDGVDMYLNCEVCAECPCDQQVCWNSCTVCEYNGMEDCQEEEQKTGGKKIVPVLLTEKIWKEFCERQDKHYEETGDWIKEQDFDTTIHNIVNDLIHCSIDEDAYASIISDIKHKIEVGEL